MVNNPWIALGSFELNFLYGKSSPEELGFTSELMYLCVRTNLPVARLLSGVMVALKVQLIVGQVLLDQQRQSI